ncbi:Protein FAM136A [Fukomys damarensis]|uniref:Protein FAM136A n=1 Tax=Fukomys damarensis TaxID=885580 RepID=A0A091CWC2_FUKDA|nr:Protein FAM136A [Fukomys damarensis]
MAMRGQMCTKALWVLAAVQGRLIMAVLQPLQVQEADSMVKTIKRKNIWKIYGLTFRCSADCCENNQASMQQCMEGCHAPLAQGQALVTKELEKLQDHLVWCMIFCDDEAQDSVSAGTNSSWTFVWPDVWMIT